MQPLAFIVQTCSLQLLRKGTNEMHAQQRDKQRDVQRQSTTCNYDDVKMSMNEPKGAGWWFPEFRYTQPPSRQHSKFQRGPIGSPELYHFSLEC
jgi:hypothetical protein